jgi:phenylacetate-CoA ligase
MQLSEKSFKALIPIITRHYIGLLPGRFNPFARQEYAHKKSIIRVFDSWNVIQQQQFVFQNIKQNVEYAYSKIPFYREYYDKNNFQPKHLNGFNDIQRIPLINKRILLEYPIEKRCCQIEGAVKRNTGGSSGHTLDFYIDRDTKKYLVGSHMTTIWEKIGYKNSDLKLVMNGQNSVINGVDFCFQSNSIRLDIYKEFHQTAQKLKKIAKYVPIRFLHGYPSIIYEFALFCDEFDHELNEILRKSLKGAFLGSEFPHPRFRDKIEEIFCIDTVNWYGHTEGAVLAWEKKEKFRYYPFQTYGFAEITKEGHLVASNYYDKATPFIRYDTEDCISDAEIKNGFLISFDIKEGRSGEYVTDKNGKKISLTGLIFGRHHKLFDYCSHIQICQAEKGEAVILYVPKENIFEFNPEILFDSNNIEMEFKFRKLNKPIKTKSGKLNLLVKPDQLEE